MAGKLIFVGLLGLVLGSFINVVIYRLPIMLDRHWREDQGEEFTDRFDLALPASSCPHCHHALRWFENIPLLSFLLQAGRCRYCAAKIHWRYPVVELSGGILALLAFATFPEPLRAIFALGLLLGLLALFWIDLEHHLLPDVLTLGLLWVGLIANTTAWAHIPIREAVIGAAAGYVSLWIIREIFARLTGKDGMGLGDVKLLAALGAWLGWQALPMLVLSASMLTLIVGGTMLLLGKSRLETQIPFGPALAVAGVLMLFFQ